MKVLARALLATLWLCVSLAHAAPIGDITDATSLWRTLAAESDSPPAVASAAIGLIGVAWSDVGIDGSRDVFVSTAWEVQTGSLGPAPADVAHDSTVGNQTAPAIAMDAVGNSVVVWQSETPGPGSVQGVFARQFAPDGKPVAPEFQVDAASDALASSPAVAMDAFGNFVVVWLEVSATGSSTVLLQRFLAHGEAVGPRFHASPRTDALLRRPAVAMGAWGEFAVAWEREGKSQGDYAVDAYVRSFASDGTPDGPGTSVSSGEAERRAPAVAMDAHGRYVVAWNNKAPTGEHAILARQYPDVPPRMGEFTINESVIDEDILPAAAMDASGDFAIAWETSQQQFPPLRGRIFSQHGTALGELRPVLFGNGAVSAPRVAMDADGDVIVVEHRKMGDDEMVHAIRYVGPEDVQVSVATGNLPGEVQPDELFDYSLTITNHHPVSTETGIAAVDSAIGVVDRIWSSTWVSGWVNEREGPAGDCSGSSPGSFGCKVRRLAAGAAITLTARMSIHWPGEAWIGTSLYTNQTDSIFNDDSTEDTILVKCAPGTGGQIVFTGIDFEVDEGGPSVAVQLDRVGGSCGEVSIGYSTEGTASASDFRVFNGYEATTTVSWGHADQSSNIISVFGNVDWLDEINDRESVEISLALIDGSADVDTRKAVVLINDKEGEPEVRAGASSGALYEGQSGYFYAGLTWRSERPVSVPFTLGGQATPGEDYVAPQESTIVIQPGTLFATVVLQTLTDGIDEGQQESVTFTLGTPTNAHVDRIPSWSLAIFDSDPAPFVNIITGDASVVEGQGVYIVASLSAPSGADISVPVQIVTGHGDIQVTPQILRFLPGRTQVNALIATVQDAEIEPDEVAKVRLVSDGTARLGADTEFALTIMDDDKPPVINFAVTEQAVRENAGTAVLRVVLSNPTTVPVYFSFERDDTGSSATYGNDYSYSNNSFAIPPGQTSFNAAITLGDDMLPELDEKAVFRLTNVVNGDLGSTAVHSLTILDNDPVVVRDAVRSATGL